MESFILYAISDSIGETAQQVAKAAISQFDIKEETYDIRRFPYVSTKETLMEILESAKRKKTIVLLNKIDLDQAIDETAIEEFVGKDNIIKISALKNEGIEQIHDKIESMVFAGDVKSSSNLVITNSRHKDALFKAYNSINDAIAGIDQRLPYDFIEVDFKNIWDYLGYINGDTVLEDLLDTIFAYFCIGK